MSSGLILATFAPLFLTGYFVEYPNSINSKLPKVGTTIFTVMSKMAADYNAINLSQGFPDFPVDPKLISLVNTFMQKGNNQYPPMGGVMTLRERIAEKTASLYGASYDPEHEVTVTAGATQAIFTAIQALIREEDEVIIFTPAYDCYAPAVELAGGKAIYVPLQAPDFQIDWEEVKKLVTRRTRMIMINTPHNPTGTIWRQEDLIQLERITAGNDIIILSDEVYEHIVFDGEAHQSVARYPKLAERSVIVGSFGKTFHATGWKVGYTLAPKNIMAEFRKVHQYNVFTVNHPVQLAIAEYMKSPDTYLEVSAMYQAKRDFFLRAIAGSKFSIHPSSGTYFQLLGYEKLSNKSDIEFASELTQQHGVASIPISVFYHNQIQNGVLRFCFAKEDETLEKAAEILVKL